MTIADPICPHFDRDVGYQGSFTSAVGMEDISTQAAISSTTDFSQAQKSVYVARAVKGVNPTRPRATSQLRTDLPNCSRARRRGSTPKVNDRAPI